MLMDDPVLAPDGNSYDRDALLRWADEHTPPRLPLTNLPFSISQLVTNRSLRDAIDDWKVQVGLSVPPPNNNNTLPPPAGDTMIPEDDLPPWVPQEVCRHTLQVSDLVTVVEGGAEVGDEDPSSSTLEVAVGSLPTDIHMQRPLHVVIVMDVSGSMSAPASKRNALGEEETFANCVLDLVKYAALAVSRMLNKNDFYSLVTYSDSAKLLLDHVPGDKWPLIASTIDGIKPGGATDLGSGFRQALDCVVRHANAATVPPPSSSSAASSAPAASIIQNAVLLLTDGAPNTGLNGADMHRSFSRVHAATLSRTIINTYAFGYADDLASELMFEIATKGNGSFSYIPDVGFLGTVFIHAVANLRAVVSVVPEGGIHSVSCGQVRCGIAKVEFDPRRIMPTDITQSCAASGFQVAKKITGTVAGAVTVDGVKKALAGKDFGANATEAMLAKEILRSIHAQKVCDCILRCISGELGDPSESNFYALLGAANADLEAVQHIPYDIEQQVGPAFREAYYKRWGKHFLLSFVSAHIHQQCNNFKDKSVGGYKTAFIADKHDRYDDIFNMMEPPRPTDLSPPPAPTTTRSGNRHQQSRTTITNTFQINNSRDPCVHEDSQVRMANGDLKAAKDVRPGDHVTTVNGTPVVMSHVIRTECKGGSANLISFPPPSFADGFHMGDHEGLRITPWHPVFIKEVSRSGSSRGPGTWKLPCDTGFPARAWKCDHVYSFCVQPLSDAPVGFEPALMIDGVAVVYLAHGRSEPPLLKHSFFGTQQVLQQLPTDIHIHTFAPEPVIKDDDSDDYAVSTLQQLGISKGSGLACAWDMRKLVTPRTTTTTTTTTASTVD